MPKIVKKNKSPKAYDLKKPFASENRGKRYTSNDFLRAWFDFSASPDSRINGLTTTKVSSPTSSTTTEFDKNFNFMSFDGTNDYLHSADNDLYSFPHPGGLTFSVWARSSNPQTSTILSKGNLQYTPAQKEYQVALYVSGDNTEIQFDIIDGADILRVTTNSNAFKTSGWNHIAATYDGTGVVSGLKVYVNGVIQSVTTLTTGAFDGMQNLARSFVIAARDNDSTPNNFYRGDLAELAIFGSELTPEEVLAIYDATTSGVRKVKSGIISNPPRYRIRQLDQKSLAYPSRLTMGDHDNLRRSKKPFDDSLTIRFGRKYSEKFVLEEKLKPKTGFPLNFGIITNTGNRKLGRGWVSSKFMQVRQETIVGEQGSTFNDGALVFAGNDVESLHTTGSRWIRTTEKIRSPEISFDLIVGPYDNRKDPSLGGLRLSRGALSDTLKIQCSTGSIEENSWTTIKTINAVTASFNFTSLTDSMITSGVDRNLVLPKAFSFDKRLKSRRKRKRNTRSQKSRIQVFLSANDFKRLGDSDFYFRIIQETPSDPKRTVWALGEITIKSANDNISLPLVVDKNTKTYSSLFENYVSSPNLVNSFEVKSRAVAGLSDKHMLPNETGKLTPFKSLQSHASDNASDSFYDVGTPGRVFPGFGSRLADKTQIVVDLSPSTQKTFGSITPCTHKDTDPGLTGSNPDSGYFDVRGHVGNPQNLMVYWNQKTRSWDDLGKFSANMFSGSVSLNNTGSLPLKQRIQGNVAGFGPIGTKVLTSSAGFFNTSAFQNESVRKDLVYLGTEMAPPEINQAQGLPTDLFGFPFSGQYTATDQQAIKAKDLGITKPFLLEKCSLVFDANFNIPPQFQVNANGMYNNNSTFDRYALHTATDYDSQAFTGVIPVTLKTNVAMLQPVFFIARQYKKQFTKSREVSYNGQLFLGVEGGGFDNPQDLMLTDGGLINENRLGTAGTATRNIPIFSGSIDPLQDRINYTNRELVPKSTSRDLITYGRMMIAVSGSTLAAGRNDNPDNIVSDNYPIRLTLDELLENGFNRDLDITVDASDGYDGNSAFQLTGSYKLDFESRNTPAIAGTIQNVIHHVQVEDGSGNPYTLPIALGAGNSGGRESGAPGEGRRGIVNPLGAFTPEKEKFMPGAPFAQSSLFAEGLKTQLPKYDNLNQHSPYLIMPEDELIFGWQFPLPQDLFEGRVFINTPEINMWSMTLRGGAKLHMYGSALKEGKEYHEGRSQNLTSNAVHEVIGAEPVLDTFNISQRKEYSDTYLDRHVNVPDRKLVGGSFAGGLVPAMFRTNATRRVNSVASSSINMPINHTSSSFNRFVLLQDPNRIFLDSRRRDGHFFRVGLTKGRDGLGYALHTTHSYTPGDEGDENAFNPAKDTGRIRSPISSSEIYASSSYGTFQTGGTPLKSKYVFSMRHFGHYADMFKQGLDGRFSVPPFQSSALIAAGIETLDISAQSAVSIKFVSGSSSNNFQIKNYYLTENPEFIGNRSRTSTSSFGFIDSIPFAGDPTIESSTGGTGISAFAQSLGTIDGVDPTQLAQAAFGRFGS